LTDPWNSRIWLLNAYANSPGFYIYDFFRLVAWWGNAAAAPPLLYACLFQSCLVTRTVLLPVISTFWFAYLIVRHVIFELEGAKSYQSDGPSYDENTVLNHFELELAPPDANVSRYEHLFYSEFLIIGAFSLLSLLGTLAETFRDGWRACTWSCFVAIILPWMCYAQTGIFNNLVWGGNPCPTQIKSQFGALWFKATQTSAFDMLVIRLFLIQAFGILMAYLAKLLTQDHLPLGISFPIRSGWLRFVLPAYFLSFWGMVGRLMQSSFQNPSTTIVIEALLVFQELVQVWAYMHQKGPLAYLLSLALGRGSAKVSADAATPEYRTLSDLPSKAFTYNFLICAHTVTEAITVVVAGLVPLVYNYNIANTELVDRSATLANLVIALVGETLIADGLFCIMASRQQRQAHTFLATWQLRPRGSIVVFVAAVVVAILPAWYALLLTQVPKKDSSNFGYFSYPKVLADVVLANKYYNATKDADPDHVDPRAVTTLVEICLALDERRQWCEDEVWADAGQWSSLSLVQSRCNTWASRGGWPLPD